MTTKTSELSLDELDAVSGGVTLPLVGSTITLPHIPRNNELLTPQQIQKILSLGSTFNPLVPRS